MGTKIIVKENFKSNEKDLKDIYLQKIIKTIMKDMQTRKRDH